jgi:hypothetical protein
MCQNKNSQSTSQKITDGLFIVDRESKLTFPSPFEARSQGRFFLHACASIRPLAWNNSTPNERILMKCDI